MKHKICNIIGCVFVLMLCFIPAWLMQGYIRNIKELKSINEDDLVIEETIFVKFDTVHRTNISDSYEIYVEEYDVPYYISATHNQN